jgi:hypothetical protein
MLSRIEVGGLGISRISAIRDEASNGYEWGSGSGRKDRRIILAYHCTSDVAICCEQGHPTRRGIGGHIRTTPVVCIGTPRIYTHDDIARISNPKPLTSHHQPHLFSIHSPDHQPCPTSHLPERIMISSPPLYEPDFLIPPF